MRSIGTSIGLLFVIVVLLFTVPVVPLPAAGSVQQACGGSEASGVQSTPAFPIRVALLLPLSGDVRVFGESVRDGCMIAVEEARRANWNIEVVIADSKCDAQEAANAANKVIFEDGVNYIIGEVCSSASIPISEIAEANHVVQISPTSTHPAVTIGKEYVFRACFLDPFQGQVMALLARNLGASRAAALYDSGNDYVRVLAETFASSFVRLGGSVPVYEPYTRDHTDFSAILNKATAANVDVVFLPDYYPRSNLIAAQIRQIGMDAILLGTDGWDSPELLLDLFEGGYFSSHFIPEDSRQEAQAFVQLYRDRYGSEPDALAALGYDAMQMLLQAIAEAGQDDPELVRLALEGINYEGATGPISFDRNGDAIKQAPIVKIQGAKRTYFGHMGPPDLGVSAFLPFILRVVASTTRELPPYDDGAREAWAGGAQHSVMAVRYTISPPARVPPARVHSVRFYLGGEMRPMRFIVWNGAWQELYSQTLTPNAPSGGGWWTWTLPAGVMGPQSEVYVGYQCLSDYSASGPWVGYDTSQPKGETYAGPWPPQRRTDGNAMIRVIVQ